MTLPAEQHEAIANSYDKAAADLFVPAQRRAEFANTANWFRRQLFIRQQTLVINAIRAHMAEFGIVAPVGRQGVEALLEVVTEWATASSLARMRPHTTQLQGWREAIAPGANAAGTGQHFRAT